MRIQKIPPSPDHVSNVPQHLRTEESACPGGVGEVTHQMLIQGGPTRYPFIHHFLRKRYPFLAEPPRIGHQTTTSLKRRKNDSVNVYN